MKKYKILILFFLIIILSAKNAYCQTIDDFLTDNGGVLTNEIIVGYKTESAQNADRILLKKLNPTRLSTINRANIYRYPSNQIAKIELEKFRLRKDVSFADFNYILKTGIVPNDTRYDAQYFLKSCKFDLAWDLVKGNGSILVAAVDTGFPLSGHEDITNLQLPGYNGFDGSSNTTPQTVNLAKGASPSHGTQVSGLIAAVTNNNLGISSGSWSAKLLPTKATAEGGILFSSWIIKCFEYCGRNDVQVLNASISPIFGDGGLIEWIKPFYDKNLIFVNAAGNEKQENLNTSKYIVRVGALDSTDKRASFSNYGIGVDIFAPGTGIVTTTLNNQYSTAGGTSFSSPIVASLAVLLKTIKPNMNNEEFKRVLKMTAIDLNTPGWDIQSSWGKIDAYNAVRYVLGQYNPVDNFPPVVKVPALNDKKFYKGSIVSGTPNIYVAADDNFGLSKVEVFIDDIKYFEFKEFTYSLNKFAFVSRDFANGNHVIKAIATDLNGFTSQSSTTVNIQNIVDNIKPTINFIRPQQNSVINGQFISEVEAIDDDSIERVDFFINDSFKESIFYKNLPAGTVKYQTTFNTDNYSTGDKIIKAIAYDVSKNSSEVSLNVKFTDEIDNTPPTVFITSPQTLQIVRAEETIYFRYISRDDRGIVKYKLYRNNVEVVESKNPVLITYKIPASKEFPNGDYTFYIEAIDLNGNIGRSLPIVLRKR